MSAIFSVAYGAINGHTTFGIFALMRQIKDTGEVPEASSLGMQLRCASAAALTLGAVLFGGRIAPVTGRLWLAGAFWCMCCIRPCLLLSKVSCLSV